MPVDAYYGHRASLGREADVTTKPSRGVGDLYTERSGFGHKAGFQREGPLYSMFYGPSIASQNCNSIFFTRQTRRPFSSNHDSTKSIELPNLKVEDPLSKGRRVCRGFIMKSRQRFRPAPILLARVHEKVGEFPEVSPNTSTSCSSSS